MIVIVDGFAAALLAPHYWRTRLLIMPRAQYAFPLFGLGRSGLGPRTKHRNTDLFEVTGVTRDNR